MIWGGIRLVETHDGHSGYEFPWSVFRLLPFGSDATYHDFHHTKNVGNYSSLMTVWDTIFDSNTQYWESYPEGKMAKE
jgi:sterol desaturase/sphingolipid hydroxylase (fatty acid hydroxylase superfamily)